MGDTYVMPDGTPVPAAEAVTLPPDILAAACAQVPLPTPFSSHPDPHGYDELFVVAIIGDAGCGKSALLERFADDRWKDAGPTIGVDMRMKSFHVASRDIICRLQVNAVDH